MQSIAVQILASANYRTTAYRNFFRGIAAMLGLLFGLPTVATSLHGQGANLNSITRDIHIPPISPEPAQAGKRVKITTSSWPKESVYHTLHLPTNWQANLKFPILVEFAGNGNYRNGLGDSSSGRVEDCVIGYGLSEGQDYIWLTLPFIELSATGTQQNCLQWWGDVALTKRYALQTLDDVCLKYGGDADRVVLCGFSRGSIACNYIGLHDDEIAKRWSAFFCHSHYDGVRPWPYPDSTGEAAFTRLKRLNGRPQWISHEESITDIERYLKDTNLSGQWTFQSIPFPNHSAEWLLCDLPERTAARKWLRRVLDNSNTRP
jgi:hypothetical protein